jgi:hypothetical protein
VLFSVTLLALAALLTGCDQLLGGPAEGDEDESPQGGDPQNAPIVYVGDNIAEDTVWSADHVYVAESSFYVRAKLTIEAGTEVRMCEGCWIDADSGTITSAGTGEEPVVFTAAGTPVAGYWRGIEVAASGSSFEHTVFRYAETGLHARYTPVTITNCTVAFCSAVGVDLDHAEDGTTITGTTFYGNAVPLVISGWVPIDDSNVFHDPEDPSVTNTHNGIHISDNVQKTMTWAETEVPFVFDDSAYIRSALTLNPGVAIKVKNGHWLDVDDPGGSLYSVGTANAPVVFTAYTDDSVKGDTDNAPTPAAMGYWRGIDLTAPGSTFDHTVVTYAETGLYAYYEPVTVRNSTFAHCSVVGLDLSESETGTTMAANVFYGNEVPVEIRASLDIDDSNAFRNPADPTVTNAHNAIHVSHNITSAVHWSELEVPYVLDGGTYIRARLQLAPDVVIKMKDNAVLMLEEDGYMDSTDFENAVFTAYSDDAHPAASDTDDGEELAPAPDYWRGIDLPTNSSHDLSDNDDVLTSNDYPSNILYAAP